MIEGKQKKIQKYFYKDNFQDGRIIFECEASDILEADEKYKQVIGKDVSKQPNIACWWDDIDEQNAINEKGQLLFPAKDEYIKKLEEENLSSHLETYEKVCELSQIIKEHGGRALLVGGSVRDTFFGKIPKDFDLEVYGLELESLKELVGNFGSVKEVGESFGILHIALGNGMDIDVSLPRTDSKIPDAENEHTAFIVDTNPYMSIKDAAKRRDFTINSLAADPLTGELFDYYGGLDDIGNRILRVTDSELFKDDALRVLRGLQFISRFELAVETETAEIMGSITPRIEKLSKARITEEWKKLLLKGKRPSLGLEAGMRLGIFEKLYPELVALNKTPQDPIWHPEGNVWVHTLMVADQEARVCRKQDLSEDRRFIQMLASICHDLGKPETTEKQEDGTITSYGHEQKGEKPTLSFLDKITDQNKVKELVVKLVTNHMTPGSLYRNQKASRKVSDGSIERLARRLHPATIQELVMLCEADSKGRGFSDLADENMYEAGAWLTQKAEELGVYKEKPKPLFTGKDLLALGFKEGKPIGIMIELGMRLRGHKNMLRKIQSNEQPYSKEEALSLIKGITDPEEAIFILKTYIFNAIQKIRGIRRYDNIK